MSGKDGLGTGGLSDSRDARGGAGGGVADDVVAHGSGYGEGGGAGSFTMVPCRGLVLVTEHEDGGN